MVYTGPPVEPPTRQPQQSEPETAASDEATATSAHATIIGAADETNDGADNALRAGLTVAIHGLTGATELNGQVGICEWFDEGTGRWAVKLPSGEIKSVKPNNLSATPLDNL